MKVKIVLTIFMFLAFLSSKNSFATQSEKNQKKILE